MSPVATRARAEWSRRLGHALADAGLVPDEILWPLIDEAIETDRPLVALVIERKATPPSVVVTMLAQLAQLPPVDLETERPLPEVADLLPPAMAAAHGAVALRAAANRLVVVFAEPPEADDLAAISHATGHEIVPALGDPFVIESLVGPASRSAAARGPVAAQQSDPARAGAVSAPVPPPPPPPSSAPVPSRHLDPARRAGANGDGGVTDEGAGPPMSSGISRVRGTTLHVDDLLRYAVGIGASDLHLTVNMPPTLRLHGALRPLEDVERLDNDVLREMIYSILTQSQREQFEEEHELDTSHSIAGVGRFRVNVCMQRGTIAVALRPIPHDVPEFSTLGVPESVAGFANLRRGLVLVTGPTGSGKSTTLASLLDIINRNRPLHIVTVEDPIEFLHAHKRSIISQREVGADTLSFAEALRRALRQDPDVILVGEMRDLETIATALTASETGHLVFATLHTQDAPSTIDRIIDVFPPNQQDQIRIQLGSALAGVVTQQLVPTTDGRGRAVACEVLVCTPAIQNLIRGAKTHQIYSLMQTGAQYGMQTMDQSLALLVKQGKVTQAVALDRCKNEEDFRNHLVGK